jgi:hypothetical protein
MDKKLALVAFAVIIFLVSEFAQYPCVKCSEDNKKTMIKIDYPQVFSTKVMFVSVSVEFEIFFWESGNVTCYLDDKQIFFSEIQSSKSSYTLNLDYPSEGRHEIKVELIVISEYFTVYVTKDEAKLSFDLSEPAPTPTATSKPTVTPEITLTTSPSSSPTDKTNQPPIPAIALLVAVICAAPISAGMLLFRRKHAKQKTKTSSNQ